MLEGAECLPSPRAFLRRHLAPLAKDALGFGAALGEARLTPDARLDSGLPRLPFHLGLPLADLGGALQRLKVRLLAGLACVRNGEFRTAEIKRLLARKDLFPHDEFPDLVVRHSLLAQFLDTRLATGKLLAEGLLLHLVEAGLELLLRVLEVVVA